ncbi:hypothetical protein CFC21_073834 [Triticum aestivum]|uniref:Uncharacterized protein n=2 Tax=Triticum aestivum TaxID=4565 RepID=A0A3B6LUB9_WHEAT|nr:hypothetical protein CFC21_073834 [Triticum aestivum]
MASRAKARPIKRVLCCVAEGEHPMPLCRSHQGEREDMVYGEGRLCCQFLQEAIPTWLQVRK